MGLNRRKISAFTLVELMVVVAILVLLISLLLPPLSRAREEAKVAVCLTNLRALGVGFTNYTASSNYWYPAACGWGGDPPTWDRILQPNYQDYRLLQCPGDRLPRPSGHYPRSYAINLDVTWMGPSTYGDNYTPPYNGRAGFRWPGWVHRTTDVEIPGETVLLGDMWESDYYGYMAGRYNYYPGCGMFFYQWGGYDNTERRVTYYHRNNDSANFLFCDGHAATLSEDDPQIASTTSEDPEDAGYYWLREKP